MAGNIPRMFSRTNKFMEHAGIPAWLMFEKEHGNPAPPPLFSHF
jgi:hypothetical protein